MHSKKTYKKDFKLYNIVKEFVENNEKERVDVDDLKDFVFLRHRELARARQDAAIDKILYHLELVQLGDNKEEDVNSPPQKRLHTDNITTSNTKNTKIEKNAFSKFGFYEKRTFIPNKCYISFFFNN